MASVIYTPAKSKLLSGDLDLNGHDIRAKLVMTNTTVDTQEDAALFSEFTTIDTFDGSGYSDKALANETVTPDTSGNLGKFDADDVTWSALPAGTRNVQGVLIYRFVDGAGNDVPICFIEFASVKTPDGSDFVIVWNASGILNLT